MLTSTDFTLYVVGGMVYNHAGRIYIEDVKALDATSRLPFWKQVVVVSPVKPLTDLGPSLVEFPIGSIRHYGVDADAPIPIVKLRLKKLLRSLLGDQMGFYEFLGVGAFGNFGFKVAIREGEAKSIIAFDAPILTQKPGVYWRREPTSLWKVVFAPPYFLYQAHFRKWAIKNAMAVHVVGEGILQELSVGLADSPNVISQPLSVVTEDDMVSPSEFDERWRAKADRNRFTIMCADRLAAEKGVFELVRAVEKRSGGRGGKADAVLHLYSSGPLKEEILSYVRRRRLSEAITYEGRVARSTLVASMRDCDLFVNLTKSLDLNRAMIDAASQGCAIIGSNLPGPRSFFKHAESAWLIDPNSPDEICSAIDYLLTNYRERRRIANEGLSIARTLRADKVKARLASWYMARFELCRKSPGTDRPDS